MADEWERLFRTMDAFLLEVESARDEADFCSVAARLLTEAIPVDYPCALLYLGEDDTAPSVLCGDNRFLRDFNAYYRYRLPFEEGYAETRSYIDFYEFLDSEYVADFLRPRGVRYVLGAYRGFIPNLLRSRGSPPFSEPECRLFNLLLPHLDRLYGCHRTRTLLSRDSVRPSELAYDCRVLSRREAEIVRLSSRRLTAREIASLLCISRRTVERHLANVYAKIGVSDRAGLLAKLYSVE